MAADLFSAGFAWADDEPVSQVPATPIATPLATALPSCTDQFAGAGNMVVAGVATVADDEPDDEWEGVSQEHVARSATAVATPQTTGFCGLEACQPAGVAPVSGVAAWEAGVARLNHRRPPSGAEPREWAQIVQDARALMRLWGRDFYNAGWSVEDVFGVEPNAAHRRLDRLGLVSFINGGMVESFDADCAWTMHGSDRLTYRRRLRADGAVPLWAVGGGEVAIDSGARAVGGAEGVRASAYPFDGPPVNRPIGESEREISTWA